MTDPESILAGLAAGRRVALARLLTWLEAGDPRGREAVASLSSASPLVIGMTGPPGTGKSTITDRLVTLLRDRGESVAVLAIDPSSPRTGGALLGDRIRMSQHTHDDGVYIRSMASRGQLGGLSATVPSALRAIAHAGFERVIVETVGVGQVETDIADHADTTVVVLTPGLGDDIQASKAGLLEIADVFVINKADIGGAEQAAADLNASLDLRRAHDGWRPPVVTCSALRDGDVNAVLDAIDAHGTYTAAAGEIEVRRSARRVWELRNTMYQDARARVDRFLASVEASTVLADVADGRRDPQRAALCLMESCAASNNSSPSRAPTRLAAPAAGAHAGGGT